MDQRISAFRLDEALEQAMEKRPPRRGAPVRTAAKRTNGAGANPVAQMRTTVATALKQDPSWQEF